eukprot:GILK01012012.1.p1 GENE.GILK01012012.1~~GILK01012012.1.p1  ORF type:complete len:296 (+),score=77.92 GILK01012012.1:74-961(+)
MSDAAYDYIKDLLGRHKQMYSEQLGLQLENGSADVVFQWMCAAVLFGSATVDPTSLNAAKALFANGWTSAEKMAASTEEERSRLLFEAGYRKACEGKAKFFGAIVQHVLEQYGGDLNGIREATNRKVPQERKLLNSLKGVGDVTIDIFFNEVQLLWVELIPFASSKAMEISSRLGLGRTPEQLYNYLTTVFIRLHSDGDKRSIELLKDISNIDTFFVRVVSALCQEAAMDNNNKDNNKRSTRNRKNVSTKLTAKSSPSIYQWQEESSGSDLTVEPTGTAFQEGLEPLQKRFRISV